MRTFEQYWNEDGCREHRATYAKDWAALGWIGAMKESGLAGPVQEAQIEADSSAPEPRGEVLSVAEGQDSGEGTEGA